MISSVGQYFNRINLQNIVKVHSNPILTSKAMSDCFVKNSVANVSFTSVDDSFVGKAIRELGDVPCPYSGINLIAGKELTPLTKEKMKQPSSEVIPLLKPFKSRMHRVEREVFSLMESLSKKNPEKNIRQLLDIARPDCLKRVKDNEYRILSDISKYGKRYLKEDEYARLSKLIDETVKIINEQNENYIFRRRKFIDKITKISNSISNEKHANKLIEIAEQIPQANENLDAFVIKYSQKNPKNNTERKPHNIAMALLRPSVGSLEHIVPRHPSDGSPGGTNKFSNYIYACCELNSLRKNMPLAEWVEKNPDVPQNMQKYIDAVIEKINKKQAMQNCRVYPLLVAKTLYKESNGKINLDVSKLKLSPEEIKSEMEKVLKQEEKIDNKALKKRKSSKNVFQKSLNVLA